MTAHLAHSLAKLARSIDRPYSKNDDAASFVQTPTREQDLTRTPLLYLSERRGADESGGEPITASDVLKPGHGVRIASFCRETPEFGEGGVSRWL